MHTHEKAPTIHIIEVSIYSDIKPTGLCAVPKNHPTLVKTSIVQKDVMSFLFKFRNWKVVRKISME
jgi:hypothetical protein